MDNFFENIGFEFPWHYLKRAKRESARAPPNAAPSEAVTAWAGASWLVAQYDQGAWATDIGQCFQAKLVQALLAPTQRMALVASKNA